MILSTLLHSFADLCIATAYAFHWDGCCLLFFGEYPFPTE